MAKTQSAPRTAADPTDSLQAAATGFLNWMAAVDPLYAEYIGIARSELHRSDLQLVGCWIAYVLENGAHMQMAPRPEFEPGYQPKGTSAGCAQCGAQFKILFPGQRYCGNTCADKALNAPGYDEA